jgi:rubredoxin
MKIECPSCRQHFEWKMPENDVGIRSGLHYRAVSYYLTCPHCGTQLSIKTE